MNVFYLYSFFYFVFYLKCIHAPKPWPLPEQSSTEFELDDIDQALLGGPMDISDILIMIDEPPQQSSEERQQSSDAENPTNLSGTSAQLAAFVHPNLCRLSLREMEQKFINRPFRQEWNQLKLMHSDYRYWNSVCRILSGKPTEFPHFGDPMCVSYVLLRGSMTIKFRTLDSIGRIAHLLRCDCTNKHKIFFATEDGENKYFIFLRSENSENSRILYISDYLDGVDIPTHN